MHSLLFPCSWLCRLQVRRTAAGSGCGRAIADRAGADGVSCALRERNRRVHRCRPRRGPGGRHQRLCSSNRRQGEPATTTSRLQPGMVATLTVVSVASTSAVCQVDSSTRDLAVGDVLSLPKTEVEQHRAKECAGNTRVVSHGSELQRGRSAGRGGARRHSASAAAGNQPVARTDRL